MRFSVLNFINIKQSSSKKKIRREEKGVNWINFNPGLALAGFQTILPGFKQVNRTWARDPIEKPSFGQRSTLKKHVTSMSCKLGPAIWSHDTGEQIPYFDRCQLIITWMSDIKEVPVNQGCMSLSIYYWSMAAMLCDSTAAAVVAVVVVVVVVVVRTRPRAIPLAMVHMRKSIHGFPSVPLYGYGAPLGGLRSPELRYKISIY